MFLQEFQPTQMYTLTAGVDLHDASNDPDRILALDGADTLRGMGGNDYISGDRGDDVINGNWDNDTIRGGDGNDLLWGGRDEDWLYGDPGNDTMYGDLGNDMVLGGDGDDFLLGNQGNDQIAGNAGNDTLYGGKDGDFLRGGQGNDLLFGDLGNDTLYGDMGSNLLQGGEGSDLFVFELGKGSVSLATANVVADFQDGMDALHVEGSVPFEQLDIAQGTGEYASDTVVRSRITGEYLAVLKGIRQETIDRNDVIASPSTPTNPLGSLSFQVSDLSISEGATAATLTVERTGGSTGEVRVNYATSDGSAIAGVDYLAASGTLTFANGETRKTFTINITNDTSSEPDEVLQITLTNPVGGSLGDRTQATLTILDDDGGAGGSAGTLPGGGSGGTTLAGGINGGTPKFTPTSTEADIIASGAQQVAIGNQKIYIGTWQKTSMNQDPIIASFTNGSLNWVKTDYEATGADGRGNGIFWDGTNLYGVFSTDGTQGSVSEDWRRASSGATQSWLRGYGAGGGAKISVLGRIDPATGNLLDAAYISARLSSGNTNSLAVTGLAKDSSGNLRVSANSFFNPRNTDGSAMTQVGSGSSPFDYTLLLSADLKTAIGAKAVGWTSNDTDGL